MRRRSRLPTQVECPSPRLRASATDPTTHREIENGIGPLGRAFSTRPTSARARVPYAAKGSIRSEGLSIAASRRLPKDAVLAALLRCVRSRLQAIDHPIERFRPKRTQYRLSIAQDKRSNIHLIHQPVPVLHRENACDALLASHGGCQPIVMYERQRSIGLFALGNEP